MAGTSIEQVRIIWHRAHRVGEVDRAAMASMLIKVIIWLMACLLEGKETSDGYGDAVCFCCGAIQDAAGGAGEKGEDVCCSVTLAEQLTA